ncbi:MAG: Mrp/NBP35 family ATP-binding protein [Candidatus Bathyarchaeota archaeon]|nr:Mrp/NBP35 family ATP-binding protein [Candidatus Bathyarchaeota archaeon]
MIDPRPGLISRRLEGVDEIIAVSSGKGGVGKSIVASTLALHLAEKGHSVGLLDLDFTSPATHVILGIDGLFPEEEYGILPPVAHGIKYMSITFFALDKPAPLRGADVSDAIIELLAITRWGDLDRLVIDLPPGLGDATLDVIRFVEGIRFLVVTTPSKVAYETVRKQLTLLKRLRVPVIGVVENMARKPSDYVSLNVENDGALYLGAIGYDEGLEESIGDEARLKETKFYAEASKLYSTIN